MNIVFMGTPDFSVPTLKNIIESEHHVIGIVTQPDRPKGRGKQMISPPVKEIGVQHNIPIFQPKKARDEAFIHTLKALKPDVIIVIAYGQILPKRILDIPKYGCINVHASLLPKYRGAGPIQWAIINGEAVTGVTTMQMDVGLDTGDMLLKEELTIAPNETGGSLHDKLSTIGGDLILKTLQGLEDNTLIPISQDDNESSYAPLLDKSLGNINWQKDAAEIERLIRGLNPWPSAYSYFNGKMVKIWDGQVVKDNYKEVEPGTIVSIDSKLGILVKCGKDNLLIKEIQLQGKKRMDTPSFLRGVHIEEGMIFNHIYH